jgi:hypothetical protein
MFLEESGTSIQQLKSTMAAHFWRLELLDSPQNRFQLLELHRFLNLACPVSALQGQSMLDFLQYTALGCKSHPVLAVF